MASDRPAVDPLYPYVERIQAGDERATNELLRDLLPTIRRAVGATLGGQHPAVDDASQEAMVRLVRALPRFRGDCAVKSFAAHVSVRAAIDLVRRQKRREQLKTDLLAEPDPALPSVHERVERRALTQKLIELLPEPQAQALILRAVFGLSFDELSEVLGAPAETIRSRIKLARKAIDKAIKADPAWGALFEGLRGT